jgi:divalent metal cation (Fe/Co/Zn/Cd) transporter
MSATQNQNDSKAVALTRYAWLSISAALITIVLKTIAYLMTGSVGLLSDALEAIVNLVGASIALSMLIIAARPPDTSHMYGHSKAEYFASSAEGALILAAAIGTTRHGSGNIHIGCAGKFWRGAHPDHNRKEAQLHHT